MTSQHIFGGADFQIATSFARIQYLDAKVYNGEHLELEFAKMCVTIYTIFAGVAL